MRAFRLLICVLSFKSVAALAQTSPPPPLINPVGGGGSVLLPIGSDSSVDQVLDALDLAGKSLKDFSADATLGDVDPVTGSETVLSGKVWYQNKPDGNARIRVVFEKKKLVNSVINEKREYLLDGGMLLDRNYHLKQEVQRQVVKPGEKINPLKLGEGPFPLPLGQSKEEVHKLFDVKKIASSKDDSPGTVHLQLTPHPGTRYARKIKKMDLWVDLQNNMPIRIETVNPNETSIQTTNLLHLKLNAGLADGDFTVEKIGEDWSQRLEQLAD